MEERLMSGSIKGICIEFRGDTTKLDKALREIKNSTKDIDRELKEVDKALKFNPTSVELWRQKQGLLNEQVNQTESNLNELKKAQKQMDTQGVDKNSEAYRRVSREIVQTESKLKGLKSQLKKIGNVNLRATAEHFVQMGKKAEAAGRSMRGLSTAAAAVVASIGAITAKSASWADDINTMSKVYNMSIQDLQKYSAAAELVDVDVNTIAKSHQKLTKQMSSAQDGTGASAEAFEKLGVNILNADGSLRDADTVWQETIAALGQMENETERDAAAMQLMGKSASELNPLIEDGGETYKNFAETLDKYGLEFIDQETLNNANQFKDSIDSIKAIGMVAFQQLGTQMAAYLAPAMEKVVDLVGKIANWLSNLSPRTQTIITAIAGVLAILAPMLIGLGKLSMGIGAIIKLVAVVGPAIAALSGPILIIIGVIAAVIAIGVLLYKNWDKIKAKAMAFKNAVVKTFNDFKSKVTSTFNAIKTAIVTPIQNAINTIKGIIDKVKNFFPIKVGKILSGLKLPHFKLVGEFSITKKTVPHISVDWYKTGGIFDAPSLIGVGEAGPEAVVPLDKFWDKLDHLQGETNIVININGANKDPQEIAAEVRRILIRETNQRRLAWQ